MKKVLTNKLKNFIKLESASSIVLAVFTAVALLLSNSELSNFYFQILQFKILGLSIQHWVNDGLMAIFFFVVGMEIKKELVIGELSTFKKAALPVAAAIGGMVVPASIYYYFNSGTPHISGWAIPMATDIAFALGVLMLFGSRVPLSLKVFLLALAIVDDLGAVLVIAVFYTQQIKWIGLLLAGAALALVFISQYLKYKSYWLYLIFGILLWVGFLYSGVHATVAGVLMGLVTPIEFPKSNNTNDIYSPLEDLIHKIHPLVSYGIMPIFALSNAGIRLVGVDFMEAISADISKGVLFGLLLGKPIGILLFSTIALRFGFAQLPQDIRYKHLFGVSLLAGIGFTMSIFITELALNVDQVFYSKLSILVASLLSAVIGYLILRFSFSKKPVG